MKNKGYQFPFSGVMIRALIFIIATGLAFGSCKKKETQEEPPVKTPPKITLIVPDTTDLILEPNQQFMVSLIANSDSSAGKTLTEFKISSYLEGQFPLDIFDTVLNGNLFRLDNYMCKAISGAALQRWLFKVTDNEGLTDSILIKATIAELSPLISLKEGTNGSGVEYIHTNMTLAMGSPFLVGLLASSNPYSDAILTHLTIKRIFEVGGVVTPVDSAMSTTNLNVDHTFVCYSVTGNEEWQFIVTDANGKQSQTGFTITTSPAPSSINTYSNKILGAQLSNTGGTFASSSGLVYNMDEAMNNAGSVDWLYIYDDTNGAILAAPNDAFAASVFNDSITGLPVWPVRNATKFKMTTLNSAGFNSITTSTQILAIVAVPVPSDSKEMNLSANNVIGFMTVQGKLGLIRVNAIGISATGIITIDVKVQK